MFKNFDSSESYLLDHGMKLHPIVKKWYFGNAEVKLYKDYIVVNM